MADSTGKIIALIQAMTPKVKVDPAVIESSVSDWLDDHPEATTTVEDGSITTPKLAEALKQKILIFPLLDGWTTVNYEPGYLNSSGGVTNGGFRHTDYIPVSEGDEIAYKLTGYSSLVYIVVGYDSNKAKVTGADVVGSSSTKEGVYTVPSGVAFVRMCTDAPYTSAHYFRSETVLGTNPDAVKAYIDNADNALSARITENATELEALDGVESVKDYYVKSPNLYDPAAATVGTTYTWTDYMPVEEGERYTQWSDGDIYQLYWYNGSKTEISHVTGDERAREKVAPSGASYARLYFAKAGVTKLMFAKGIVGEYVPYGVLIPVSSLPDYVKRDTNNLNNSHIFANGLNISNVNGNAYTNNGTSVTDFIAVEEGETYYIGGEGDGSLNMTGAAAYDDDFAFVEAVTSPYTASEGVAYIRIGYTTPVINGTYKAPCVRKGAADSGLQNFNPYDTFQIVNNKPTAYEQANGLYGKKWNAMGDSITEGSGTTKSYLTYIKERTGIIPTGYGVSNTAIARRNSSYTNDMSVRYVNMTDDADIVTVFGGTNDHGNNIPIGEWGDNTVDTLYGAMKILCEGLINKYMGKKIGFILPLPKYESSTDYSYPNASFGAYIDCIKDVCKRYSIPYLDLYTESGIAPKIAAVRTAMIPDGLHPNAAGHELISWQIQRFLERL